MALLYPKQFHSPFIYTGSFYISGSVTASYFIGDGSGLTNLPIPTINTSSLVSTSSFNAFTSSYKTDSASFSSSISILVANTSSYVLNNQTSSFINNTQTSSMSVATASYVQNAQSSSYSAKLEGGKINYVPIWNTTNTQTSSSLYQSGSSNIGINVNTFDSANPETLLVSGSNINVIIGKVNINNYTQLNIVNKNSGSIASSDIVATNDTGNESGGYVDLGINSSTFSGSIGGPSDAYLYATGSNFLIGNTTSGSNANLKFFAGNSGNIFPLIITGSEAHITGSLYGSSSYALSASYAPSNGGAFLSSLLAATSTNTINNGVFAQEWQWNTLATQTGLKLSSTSTVGNASKMLEIVRSGTNSTSSKTNYGGSISITNTGTTSKNVGLLLNASGATNNFPLQLTANGGTANTDANITFNGGTFASTTPALISVTALTTNMSTAVTGIIAAIRTGATDAFGTTALYGYVDAARTSGSNVWVAPGGNSSGNQGVLGQVQSATTGYNLGVVGMATNSTTRNIGLFGYASSQNSVGCYGIGVIGQSANNGNGFGLGGYFGLDAGVAPTLTNSALVCNNYNTTSAIFSAMDNGSIIFNIIDGGNVGVGISAPTSTLHINGSTAHSYVTKTANYTATATDYGVICNTNSFTITLPTAVGCSGREYFIKQIGSGTTITLATTSSQTIDGAVPSTYNLTTQYSRICIFSDGANWLIKYQ